MGLPFDTARCIGIDNVLCKVCRRKEPGGEYQWFIMPEAKESFCINHIPTEIGDERNG